MRILLMGEYSNVHATLAVGLRALGHEVVVASNGDFWKNYPRDIDLARPEGRLGGIALLLRILRHICKFRGFDVVQLINPIFVDLKAERVEPIYRYLRRHNKKIVLGAFGMDYYWITECMQRKPLRYSDFNIGPELRHTADTEREQQTWLGTPHEKLNRLVAETCDGIVAGLYEYYVCYRPNFPSKTVFIPFPIVVPGNASPAANGSRVRIFIGINKSRSEYKGTDIMLRAAQRVAERYPERVELVRAESVPFSVYQRLMDGSDVILDQLYSYTPSMNPLLAMSKGIVCVGGGEPENYEILGETELRPIINVMPSEDDVYSQIENIVLHPEILPELKRQSILYVSRHHDHINVARKYIEFYEQL